MRLTPAQVENLVGEYIESNGNTALAVFWQGERLYGRDRFGDISELAAESPTQLFYPDGSSIPRLVAQRDNAGHVTAMVFRDDRHEERWEKRIGAPSH
jgi:hypothetical protein